MTRTKVSKADKFFMLVGMLCLSNAQAQITPATEEDIVEAPGAFQDQLRGKADKLNVSKGRSAQAAKAEANAPKVQAPKQSGAPTDLTGTWRGGGLSAQGGKDMTVQGPRPGLRVNTKVETSRICYPYSGLVPATTTIYQQGDLITLVQDSQLRVRRIYLNAQHAQPVVPSYGGDSVGHWEGDTLVVDTIGLKGPLQVLDLDIDKGNWNFLMTTPTLHVVERIKKINDGEQLEHQITFDDAATKMQTYTITHTFKYAPGVRSNEDECEDASEYFGPQYPAELR
ncbi:MAG: hypothetical protein QM808_05805 [Steroidobacteraceae bacterium]